MSQPSQQSVFISYCHADRTWLERLLIFVKPFGLEIWYDEHIQPGELWESKIHDQLQRASVGVLLVSQHFLASNYIASVELPVLLDAANRKEIKLLWIPVSASTWEYSPLASFQAMWDPRKPLEGLEEPRRNEALVRIAVQIATAAAPAGNSPAAIAVPNKERPVAAAITPSQSEGRVHGVPSLPQHFVPRPEVLHQLRRALLEGPDGAVGITGIPHRFGLHGVGGIGKSVLAAALARDALVRRSFPDGVFWLNVGESPDIPSLQAALLADAGADAALAMDERHGRELLADRFGAAAVLLVLDDVWDVRHARAFDVLGPASRLLVTTREGAVLTALDAHAETVERLSVDAALSLLANWVSSRASDLPDAARAVAHACGYLPLALAVAGARVRGGASWESVSRSLYEGRLEFLDHPYGNVFRSMRLSLDGLSPPDRERYLELAVIPEDDAIPESILLAMWKQTCGLDPQSGREVLGRLHERSLLKLVEGETEHSIALHDLQHDFLRISVHDLAQLHRSLLAALVAGISAAGGHVQWWKLPPDRPYAWIHLVRHLVAAGFQTEAHMLLLDCRWLEAKLHVAGLSAVLSDFARVPEDRALSEVARSLRLAGHVLSRDPSQLRSQLVGRLLGTQETSVRQLLETVHAPGSAPWLRPRTRSLVPPSSPLLRTLVGHEKAVTAVVMVASGRRALSGSDDGTIRVWNLESGTNERTIRCHPPARPLEAFLTGESGRQQLVQGILNWMEEFGLDGPAGGVSALAATSNGERVVAGFQNGRLKVWSLDTGDGEYLPEKHEDQVTAVALTADGRHAVSCSSFAMKLWDLESRTQLRAYGADHSPTRFPGAFNAVALTEDGRRAIVGRDLVLEVWNLETGEIEDTLTGHARRPGPLAQWSGKVRAVVLPSGGRRAVSGGDDRTIKIWDLVSGEVVHTLEGHEGDVEAIAIVSHGRRAVSGASDGTLRVWDLETGSLVRSPIRAGRPTDSVAVSPDGRVAISNDHHVVRVWDLDREDHGDYGQSRIDTEDVVCAAYTDRGPRAIFCVKDGEWKVTALEPGGREIRLSTDAAWTTSVIMTPDGRRAIAGGVDCGLRVWDLESGAELGTFAKGESIHPCGVSGEGRYVVCRLPDQTCAVYDIETGENTCRIGQAGKLGDIAVAAGSMRAVSAPRYPYSPTSEGALTVWDLRNGEELSTLPGHPYCTGIAVTGDGRRALSSSEDGTMKAWNLETGEEEIGFTAHDRGEVRVYVTPDGCRAVSTLGAVLKLWELRTSTCLAVFTADADIMDVTISSNGREILVLDGSGPTLHVLSFEVPPYIDT